LTLVTAGRVGRPHGRDGSFYVEDPAEPLALGAEVIVGGEPRSVERRAGTAERPLLRLAGIADARPLRGEPVLVEAVLEDGEWLASDLEGCRVEGAGRVERVLAGTSCDLLELDDGTLVPFVSDAIRSVDVAAGRISADLGFLGVAE
jgi:16S rRNA processing protein RimM